VTAAKKTDQAALGGAQPGRDGRADAAELELARQLAERAQAVGLSLTGPGGLLGRLTKIVLEGRAGQRLIEHGHDTSPARGPEQIIVSLAERIG
jgi:hypothetical protein